jgi:hypothetical protein
MIYLRGRLGGDCFDDGHLSSAVSSQFVHHPGQICMWWLRDVMLRSSYSCNKNMEMFEAFHHSIVLEVSLRCLDQLDATGADLIGVRPTMLGNQVTSLLSTKSSFFLSSTHGINIRRCRIHLPERLCELLTVITSNMYIQGSFDSATAIQMSGTHRVLSPDAEIGCHSIGVCNNNERLGRATWTWRTPCSACRKTPHVHHFALKCH